MINGEKINSFRDKFHTNNILNLLNERLWPSAHFKKSDLPVTGTLHQTSNVHKFYAGRNSSLRLTEIRKNMETLIWHCNDSDIWLYGAEGKVCSLSLSIFNLRYITNINKIKGSIRKL